jgi:hypothetical protein
MILKKYQPKTKKLAEVQGQNLIIIYYKAYLKLYNLIRELISKR